VTAELPPVTGDRPDTGARRLVLVPRLLLTLRRLAEPGER
jgi:hypothetical protein